MEVWQSSKCFHSCNVLPGEVKDELNIDESRYDSKIMRLELSASGNKGIKQFWYPYRVICQKKVEGIIAANKEKLPTNAKLEDLLDNRDVLGISKEILDLVVCVIPVGEKDIYVGIDSRKYLQRPYKHSQKFYKEKEPTPLKFKNSHGGILLLNFKILLSLKLLLSHF